MITLLEMKITPAFERVLRAAVRWGVDVLMFDRARVASVGWRSTTSGALCVDCNAPSAMAGIRWPERSVWWADDTDDADALELSHEVIHCVLATDPNHTEELTGPLLALEFETARTLNLPGFDAYLSSFGTADGREWGSLGEDERQAILTCSRAVAEELGLMKRGRLTYRQAPIRDIGSEELNEVEMTDGPR